MSLIKLEDFDPNYRESFNGSDVKGMGVYTQEDQKVGTVGDILVDEEGRFRYFVVDLGFWIFGKKVLLPVGRSRVDHNSDRVYAVGMTREQADNLPEFNENTTLDHDYEERVRGNYRNTGGALNTGAPLEASAPLDSAYTAGMTGAAAGGMMGASTTQPYTAFDEASTSDAAYRPVATPSTGYNYNQEPSLYGMNDQDHQSLKLYEERLIANKKRVKTGEVTVGKHVETETAQVSVPIEKERVVIERVTPTDAGRAVAPGSVNFGEGGVTRMEIYEETPDIRKEAVLREEVRVNKVVDHDTVEARETLRREELDVTTDGTQVVDSSDLPHKDRI